MSEKEHAAKFLETLLGTKVTSIEYSTAQSSKDEVHGMRSVRFDVELGNSDRVFDIEMQRAYQSDLVRRTRYYQAVLTNSKLPKGNDYSALKDTYVIFICMFDPFGLGFSQYTSQQAIKETHQFVDDGATTIYLNAEYMTPTSFDGTLDFLDYLRDPNGVYPISGSLVWELDKGVQDIKRDARERSEYMRFEDIVAQREQEAERRVSEEMVHKFAEEFGLSVEEVKKRLGLSVPQSGPRPMHL